MFKPNLKMRVRVRLDTQTQVMDFVKIANSIDASVFLSSNDLCVSGKSLLGALYTMEWEEIWCECEEDIYRLINDFIVE